MIAALALFFVQAAAPSEFPGWEVACDHHQYELTIDGDVTDARGGLVAIEPADNTPKPRCEILAPRPAGDYRGRRVRVSAYIGGSELTDTTYFVFTVDHAVPRDLVYLADGKPTKADLRSALNVDAPVLVQVEVDVPAGADSILMGVGIRGRGSLHVYDFRLEVLTSGVPADSELPTVAMGTSQLAKMIRPDSGGGGVGSQTPPKVFAKLDSVSRTFFAEWFAAWSDPSSAALRRSWTLPVTAAASKPARAGGPAVDSADASRLQRIDDPLGDPSHLLAHCHPLSQGEKNSGILRLTAVDSQLISTLQMSSESAKHAVCPSWLLAPAAPQAGDQATNADTAVASRFREYLRRERGLMIGTLNLAVATYPADNRLAELRLRLLIDQRDTVGAVRAAADCRADGWLCGMLSGYVAYWSGHVSAADSLFGLALRGAPSDVRCGLTDLRALITPSTRGQYTGILCNLRDSVNARIWWLSDPMFTEPGNERRAAQYARRVLMMTHAVVPADDPYDWANGHGGGAATDMILRYGWPTAASWVGAADDQNHVAFLDDAEPVHFTTNEYGLNRVHTVPTWTAIAHPFQATADQWELTPQSALRAKPDLTLWWPVEHFARPGGPLVQLPEYQLSMFRRDSTVLVGMSAALDSASFPSARGEAVHGSLVFTAKPDSFRFVPAAGTAGGALAGHGVTDVRPQLVGLEVSVGQGHPVAARTRFGITPPIPLSLMLRGTVALSDLALLAFPSDTLADTSDPDRLLPFMVGSTRIKNVGKMTIYWEMYGFAADDTIHSAIQVERLDAPSRLRSLAQTVGLAGRTEDKLSIALPAGRAANQAWPIAASVPVFAQHVSIDFSTFQYGHYRITITVSRKGSAPVSTSRELTILE